MNYTYVADGLVILSGEAEASSDYYPMTADGSVVVSGSSESIASYMQYSASGSVVLDGSAIQRKNLTFSASGAAVLSGSSAAAKTKYIYEPSGAATVGSSAASVCRPTYSSSGSAVVSYLASAPTSFLSEWSYDVEYDVYSSVEVFKDFSYDVGDLPFRTWRVVGVEYYDCSQIPFCAVPNGLNRMFQEIIARTIKDVCQFLSDVKWTWPLAEIQRSVYPAEAFIAVGSTGLNIFGEPVPTFNQFVSVPFSQVPECLFLAIPTTDEISMGIFAEAEVLRLYVASGSVSFSGNALLQQSYEASGSVLLGGSSDYLLGTYSTEADGYVYLSGEAEITKDSWTYASSGGAVLSGESDIGSEYWKYSGNGSIPISGAADIVCRLEFVSSGLSDVYPYYAGVNISGEAEYPIIQSGSGFAYLYGSSIAARNLYSYIPEGSVVVDGMTLVTSPYYSYETSGDATVYGDVVINQASFQIVVDDSTPITLGGTAPDRDSSGGDFWYTPILQDIVLSDSADAFVNGFSLFGSGLVVVGGSLDTDVYLAPETSAGIFSEIEFVEIAFGQDFVSDIPAATADITTTCAGCPPIPDVLYIGNNIQFTNVFSEFVLRNNITLDEEFVAYYSARTGSWQHSIHYTGIGGDNTSMQESWQINMEWSCVAQYGEDFLSSSVWKFSLYMKQRNLNSGMTRDVRMISLFPSESICQQAESFGLDFTFDFHFRQNYVTNNLGIAVDVFNCVDTIGAFDGAYWDANNFVCRISATPGVESFNTIDISAERPPPRPQFYV